MNKRTARMGRPYISDSFKYAVYNDPALDGSSPEVGDIVCGRTLSNRGDSRCYSGARVVGVDQQGKLVTVKIPGAGLQEISPQHLGLERREP